MKILVSSVVAALALVATLHSTSAFQVKDCADGKDPDAKMVSLSIDTCPDESGPLCTFIKGKNATMTMELEPSK